MMNWNYGNNMMGDFNTYNAFGLIIWVLVTIDLVLFGIWLWKQINKN